MSRQVKLSDIQQSAYLQQNGIMPGDLFLDDGSIERVFSDGQNKYFKTQTITQEEINSSKTLQDAGVKVGDILAQKEKDSETLELIKPDNENAFKQFLYSFDAGSTIISNVSTYLQSLFPEIAPEYLNTFNEYDSKSYTATDVYGKEFVDSTPQQRRELLALEKERELQLEYGQFFTPNNDGFAATAGSVAKAVVDPTTLLPVGQSLKAVAGISAGLGGVFSATEDLAKTGQVDVEKAAKTAALSAAGGTALIAGTRSLATRYTSRVQQKAADKLIDDAQVQILEKVQDGKIINTVSEGIADTDIDIFKLNAALTNTGREIFIPKHATEAAKAFEHSVKRNSALSRRFSEGIDKYLGALSTRVKDISEPVFARLRRYEFNIHSKTDEALNNVKPFIDELRTASPEIKKRITRSLYNGAFKEAESLMSKVGKDNGEKLLASWERVQARLDKTGSDLLLAGHTFEKIPQYFPRLVKDLEGLRESLGVKEAGKIDKVLKTYADKTNIAVNDIPPEKRSELIDLFMRGYKISTDGNKFKFAKERTNIEVKPYQDDFYASAEESLTTYLAGAVNDIERRNFFGRNATSNALGQFDANLSIGKIIDDELYKLTPEQQSSLSELLKARFIEGEQSPAQPMQALRNLGYLGTIANPISAITQLGDLGSSMALHGFRNTIAAAFGTKNLKLVDFGISQISKELGGEPSKTAALLDFAFRKSGFATIDRLGKETLVNASLRKATNQIKTKQGENKFKKEVQAIFQDETDSLISDLKLGIKSDNVRLYAFNKLSDVQPVSLSEMPEAYLNSANGRLLYMLKSFTLKQLDVVRNNVVKEWRKGNKVNAAKQMALLAGYLTAANTTTQIVKDTLLGREIKPESLPGRAIWSLLGVYGISKYVSERYLERGDIKGAVINYIAPATPVIDAATKLGSAPFKDEPNLETTLKAIPIMGPIIYAHFGGGAERFNERQD